MLIGRVHIIWQTYNSVIIIFTAANIIKPLQIPHQSAAYSFFLHQRLDVINSTAHQLKPQVRLMDLSEAETLSVDGPLAALVKEAQALSSQVCGLSGGTELLYQ